MISRFYLALKIQDRSSEYHELAVQKLLNLFLKMLLNLLYLMKVKNFHFTDILNIIIILIFTLMILISPIMPKWT